MSNIETQPNHGPYPQTAEFLNNPPALREFLEARGTLNFTPYRSGLFPAGDLPPEVARATGMGLAWFRDNAHVANALYEAGRTDLAVPAGRAMLDILSNNRDILEGVVDGRYHPNDLSRRLPARVQGDALGEDSERRVQNDSTGYALWFTSKLIKDGAIEASQQDLDTLAQTVRYLEKIEYWHDADEGHWEEDRRIHASSIGVVVAGLRETEEMFDTIGYRHELDFGHLMRQGRQALDAILDSGVTDLGEVVSETAFDPRLIAVKSQIPRRFLQNFSVHRREHDAALLFLIEPLQVIEGEQAKAIVADAEQHLRRVRGFSRYEGDTYWKPRFKDIMKEEERTWAAEGRTEERNLKAGGVAYSGKEAQWTLFDPILSTHWGKCYMASGDPADRQKQLFYLDRSLSQLVRLPDGTLHLPEARYHEYEDGRPEWTPNDHMPLLWSQANLLTALRMFETTAD